MSGSYSISTLCAVTKPHFTGLRCIYHPNERPSASLRAGFNGARRGPRLAQFFNPLLRSTDVEIIEALLPCRTRADAAMVKQLGESLLVDFHYDGRIAHIWFGDQEVTVLGHDY